MANKKPKKRNHFFVDFSIKNEIPIAMPIIPLEIVCKRVEPRNLSCPSEVAVSRESVAPLADSGLIKNRVFSSAANPKAEVIR